MKTDLTNEVNQTLTVDEKLRHGRRRLLVGIASAPVVLAVSGRSALACTTTSDCNPRGLSPLAWVSIHPQSGVTIKPSHTIERTCLGKSPGYWVPNCGGNSLVFQGRWPKAPCGEITGSDGRKYSYLKGTYLSAKGVKADDRGWTAGDKLPSSGYGSCSGKVISKTLIGAAPSGIERHICAAYLNIKQFGMDGYPVTEDELKRLASGLPISGRVFSVSEVKAFLDQTWT